MFSSISLVWIGFQYYWYHGCGYNDVLITITIICGVAFYGLIFIRTRPDASLLTSSVVLLYVTYLLWSALASNPNKDPECNPFAQSGTNTALQISLGLFFTFVSLIIISGSTKKSDENNLTARMNSPMMEDDEDDGERLDPVEKKGG